MWETIVSFFTAVAWWELLFILVAKSIEVTLGTLRVIMIAKGYRKQGTALSFVEIMMWVFLAATVLNGMMETPIKGIIYGIGFSVGVYLGSRVEEILAFGKIALQIIIDENMTVEVSSLLRETGYAVTVIDAHGRDKDKSVLMIIANRKGKEALFDLIMERDPKAVIVTNDVSYLKGGYLKSGKRIFK